MANKKKFLAIELLLITSTLCVISLAGYLSCDPTAHDNNVPSLFIRDLNLTRNPENVNGSFILENHDGHSVPINDLSLNDITLVEISGVALLVNGTSIYDRVPLLFELEPNDAVNVNVIVPYVNNSNFTSTLWGHHFTLMVRVPEACFWKDFEPIYCITDHFACRINMQPPAIPPSH